MSIKSIQDKLDEQYNIVKDRFILINQDFGSLYRKLKNGYTVTGINMPIFYLFDHIINSDFGDTSYNIEKKDNEEKIKYKLF
jgi:hypothetical protein